GVGARAARALVRSARRLELAEVEARERERRLEVLARRRERALAQAVRDRERFAAVLDDGARRVALGGLGHRAAVVLERALPLLGAGEVVRERLVVLLEAVRVELLDREADR